MAPEPRERLQKLLESLDAVREQLLQVVEDEESKATAYTRLAYQAMGEEERYTLALIAVDTILHREVMWAALRAVEEARQLLRHLLARGPGSGVGKPVLKAHEALETVTSASYQDLAQLAPEGTSLRRLLELLAEEEKKHEKLVRELLASKPREEDFG